VPVVDLSAERSRVVDQVGRACRDIGFLTVVGHGVPEERELGGRLRRLFALALDLPEDWFEEPFRDHSSSMRVINCPAPEAEHEPAARRRAHRLRLYDDPAHRGHCRRPVGADARASGST
jgi:isopenicillin N synthase-like dioxygenase